MALSLRVRKKMKQKADTLPISIPKYRHIKKHSITPSFTKNRWGSIVNQLIKSQMLGCQNILRGQFEKLKTVKDETFKKAKVISNTLVNDEAFKTIRKGIYLHL